MQYILHTEKLYDYHAAPRVAVKCYLYLIISSLPKRHDVDTDVSHS